MKPDPFSPFEDNSIKDTNINTKYQKRVINFYLNKKDKNKSSISVSVDEKKLLWFGGIVGFFLLILITRLFFLQIVQGEDYLETAEGNRIRIQTLKSPRGIIYDRNNNPLVKNVPSFQVVAIPIDLSKNDEEIENIISKLSDILEISKKEIREKLDSIEKNPRESHVLFEDIELKKALILDIESSTLPGIHLQINSKREYLTEPSFSHILGYIGKIDEQEYDENKTKDYLLDDYIGKTGIELSYEKVLRGIHGKKRVEVDSFGKEKEVIAAKDAIPGNNIYLSIDSDLQNKATEILKNIVNERYASAGTAIVMNPNNGEILALVNWPTYDNNLFREGISQEEYTALLEDPGKPLFNHALSGEYPPGSTFKPVVGAAALEEGVVTKNSTVNSTGGIEINQWWFPDWKEGGHGSTNITKAIAESVNTYFYLAGGGEFNAEENIIEGGLGVDKIKKYAENYGFNNLTNIDLPGEKTGFLPTRDWKEKNKGEVWYIGDTYHLAIGQGDILATPLQIANFTSIFANGGTYYKPHLVKEMYDQENEQTIKTSTEIVNENLVSSYNIDIIRQGMREAVTYGSAKQLQSLPVSSAGKTGTAQVGGTDKTHSWFTSFAPYENPEIVVTVLVEEGGEGTEAALPAAKQILNYYFTSKP
ncbi:MAG: penicillin-binding protein 2 [Patescibacteria group bacterium]